MASSQKSSSATPNFPDLTTPDQLEKFLNLKGKRHNAFYQYTNLGALKGMISSQKLYLSRADTLNDSLEGNGPKTKKTENVYIASFVFREPESIPMWSMYAFPYQEGIRLCFPKKSIKQVIDRFQEFPKVFSTETGLEIPGGSNAKLFAMDVVYAHDGYLEYNGEKHIKKTFFDEVKKYLSKDTLLRWGVKHDAWIAEREVRLILTIKQKKAILDKKVAIDFSDALKSFEIMCGPCVSEMEVEPVVKGKASIRISDYWNKTYFRSCPGCQNRTEICRERNILMCQASNSGVKSITIMIS